MVGRNSLVCRSFRMNTRSMIATWQGVALDTEDAHGLAVFYSGITGMPIIDEDADWTGIGFGGAPQLFFQRVDKHVPPNWPEPENGQQMHLEFKVSDFAEAEPRVLALGARKVGGNETSFRVYLDPAGHPFCLVR